MQELITVQNSKFVRNINEKRKIHPKKWLIKTFRLIGVVNSSVKNMCIGFVTIRWIPKKGVCQKLQINFRYRWEIVWSFETPPFADIRGILE